MLCPVGVSSGRFFLQVTQSSFHPTCAVVDHHELDFLRAPRVIGSTQTMDPTRNKVDAPDGSRRRGSLATLCGESRAKAVLQQSTDWMLYRTVGHPKTDLSQDRILLLCSRPNQARGTLLANPIQEESKRDQLSCPRRICYPISIGIAAAAVRINREEKEQGRSTAQSYESLKRRVAMVWAGETSTEKTGPPENR
nr:hypothetical protein CFP56_71250 [Quercus suber]